MPRPFLRVLTGLAIVFPGSVSAQPLGERIDSLINVRIRAEGLERSRVLETATMLSDGFGPRLAGSPEYRRAAEWMPQRVRRIDDQGVRVVDMTP